MQAASLLKTRGNSSNLSNNLNCFSITKQRSLLLNLKKALLSAVLLLAVHCTTTSGQLNILVKEKNLRTDEENYRTTEDRYSRLGGAECAASKNGETTECKEKTDKANLIQKGDPLAIVINKVHIGINNGEFFSSRPMCRFWCDTGEVAVILTLDLGNGEDPKDYFVGFFEGVNNESDLPFYDLLAYATASLDASTIRIKLTVIDMDNYSVFDNRFTNYLRELTPQISKTMPAGSAIADVLVSVGSYILKEAQKDDKIMELEFQLYDVPDKKNAKDNTASSTQNVITGIPIIEEKNFAVIRTADSREWRGRISTGDFYFSKTLDLMYRHKDKKNDDNSENSEGKKTEPVIDLPYISVTMTKKLPNLDIQTAMNFSNNVQKNIRKAITQNADTLNLIQDLTNLIINKGAEFYRQNFDRNRGNKEAFLSLLRFYTDHSDIIDKREKALIFQLFHETVCAKSDIGISEFIDPKKDLFHKVSTSALNYVDEKNCGSRTAQVQSGKDVLNSPIFILSSAVADNDEIDAGNDKANAGKSSETVVKSRWNIIKISSKKDRDTDSKDCPCTTKKSCHCSHSEKDADNSRSSANQKQSISNNPSFVNEIHIHNSGSGDKTVSGDSIRLSIGTSLFGWDSSELTEEGKVQLKGFMQFLDRHPNMKLAIIGQVSPEGTPERNDKLAKNRVDAVKNYMKDYSGRIGYIYSCGKDFSNPNCWKKQDPKSKTPMPDECCRKVNFIFYDHKNESAMNKEFEKTYPSTSCRSLK